MMEELQDAIEDAQYMNAMHDDIPRPTRAWKKITTEELQLYISKLESNNPKSLELDTMCEGSLGFYLFIKFVKDQGAKVHAEFLLDVATFRAHLTEKLLDAAKKVMNDYLLKESLGNDKIPEKRPSRLVHVSQLPNESELIEKWLTHIQPDDMEEKSNLLGLSGEHVNDVISALNVAIDHKSVSIHLFDNLDRIIFYKMKEKYFKEFQESVHWPKYFEYMSYTEKPVKEEDFSLFRVLGRGGFGMVNGCKRCQTGKLYAMKVMNKRRVKLKKAEALCLNERNILTIIDSPFVVCMKYSFVTQQDLYLILDLMTGGDLGFHLTRKGKFSSTETRYYAARILLGIKALHDQSIVYRDLKPENILMGEDGRTKISDLGLACKVGRSGLTGTCGTRGYWAPEMLRKDATGKRERYSLSVDWFSYGCCIYEFIYGVSPFRTEKARQWGDHPKIEKADKDKAIDLAIKEMEPEFDHSIDENAKDLIQKLLIKDGKTRLGCNGGIEIMSHPYFNSIDWDKIDYMPPPSVPAKDINMATQSEIGTFADEKSFKKVDLTESDHKIYEKWDFMSIKSFQEEVVEFLIYEEIVVRS